MVVRELSVGSFRLVGGAVGFRRICIDDLVVLIEVDSEATIYLVAADVVILLRVIANRFAMLDSVLFDEGPPCDRPARFVAVDICPVESLFEGDEDDLVGVLVTCDDDRFAILRIPLDDCRDSKP
ncbi:hypothetical protein [Halorubrum ezzemoulense]|uniref:hypothetical protein n=1 Tax=Halorubrum ezzemoulense TaxID=337243 RepID=UPI00232E49F5|nr:hypothetical protein [Halorubrum ezzemoulense]MDB2250110.1 hypothetical protein [Halorubrum ezzemoulense]